MNNRSFIITDIGSIKLIQPLRFIYIKAKGQTFSFQANDNSDYAPEKIDNITFDRDYWLCAYLTTQEFWEAVMKLSKIDLDVSPSEFKGNKRPVDSVSWDEVQLFNNSLNNLLKEDSKREEHEKVIKIEYENQGTLLRGDFGLPSETQWEYAALAGGKSMFAGSDNLNEVGWFDQNSHNHTMPVGLKQPNAFGLYDMSGNVWEWCADDYVKDVTKLPKNGTSSPNKKDEYKSLRGGSYFRKARHCCSRIRNDGNPGGQGDYIGFRLRFSLSSEKRN